MDGLMLLCIGGPRNTDARYFVLHEAIADGGFSRQEGWAMSSPQEFNDLWNRKDDPHRSEIGAVALKQCEETFVTLQISNGDKLFLQGDSEEKPLVWFDKDSGLMIGDQSRKEIATAARQAEDDAIKEENRLLMDFLAQQYSSRGQSVPSQGVLGSEIARADHPIKDARTRKSYLAYIKSKTTRHIMTSFVIFCDGQFGAMVKQIRGGPYIPHCGADGTKEQNIIPGTKEMSRQRIVDALSTHISHFRLPVSEEKEEKLNKYTQRASEFAGTLSKNAVKPIDSKLDKYVQQAPMSSKVFSSATDGAKNNTSIKFDTNDTNDTTSDINTTTKGDAISGGSNDDLSKPAKQ
jgi:uncharacterized protein YdaT